MRQSRLTYKPPYRSKKCFQGAWVQQLTAVSDTMPSDSSLSAKHLYPWAVSVLIRQKGPLWGSRRDEDLASVQPLTPRSGQPSVCRLSSPAAESRFGDLYDIANDLDEKSEALQNQSNLKSSRRLARCGPQAIDALAGMEVTLWLFDRAGIGSPNHRSYDWEIKDGYEPPAPDRSETG